MRRLRRRAPLPGAAEFQNTDGLIGFQARLERPDGTAVLVAEQACALDEAAYLKKLSELEGELARLGLCDAARVQIRTL